MYKKCFKRFFSSLVAIVFLFNLTLPAFATDYADTATPTPEISSTNVIFGDGYIEEQIIINISGTSTYVTRTSYENNTSIWEITENGETSTISRTTNYKELYEALTGSNLAKPQMARGRLEGYTYTYMKTVTETSYANESYGTYSALLSILSGVLALANLPGASIASIASLLMSFNASAVDAKFVTYRHWHRATETATGIFMCYYCEWSTFTYARDTNGNWVYLGKESGDFDSFDVY